jgi:hypothetical protein
MCCVGLALKAKIPVKRARITQDSGLLFGVWNVCFSLCWIWIWATLIWIRPSRLSKLSSYVTLSVAHSSRSHVLVLGKRQPTTASTPVLDQGLADLLKCSSSLVLGIFQPKLWADQGHKGIS